MSISLCLQALPFETQLEHEPAVENDYSVQQRKLDNRERESRSRAARKSSSSLIEVSIGLQIEPIDVEPTNFRNWSEIGQCLDVEQVRTGKGLCSIRPNFSYDLRGTTPNRKSPACGGPLSDWDAVEDFDFRISGFPDLRISIHSTSEPRTNSVLISSSIPSRRGISTKMYSLRL
jgi:hypothetical protein